jgi:hypothetical protein
MFFLFLSTNAWALPDKVEIWFLSEPKVGAILKLINKKMPPLLYSENTMDNCIPMGDKCFHPQYGLIDKKDILSDYKPPKIEAPSEPKILGVDEDITYKAGNPSLIKCDKNNYFDLFCGKAKTESGPVVYEIFVDTSTSMRRMDLTNDPDQCLRRSVLQQISEQCGASKVSVSVFDSGIKTLSDTRTACINYGSNDGKRMIEWIKNSTAKKLLIITDIEELSVEVKDFLDSVGAKILGGDTTRFYASDMAAKAVSFCK